MGKKTAMPTKNLEWVLEVLHGHFGLPRAWAKKRIRLSPVQGGLARAELLTDAGEPFMLIAASKAGQIAVAEAVIREELRRMQALGVGLCTDGSPETTFVLRKKHSTGEVEYAREFESFVDPSVSMLSAFRRKSEKLKSGEKILQRELLPLSANLESLFFDVHSHMRDIDGLHADEALDELTKLLQIKIADERNTVSGKPYKLQCALYTCSEELAAVARMAYAELQTGKRIQAADAIRLSTLSLTKSLACFEQYDIGGSPADVKGRAFQRVLGPAARSGMGQYFTPTEVVNFMVEVIAPKFGEIVIDPFCGSAHFLEQSIQHWNDQVGRKASAKHSLKLGSPTAIGIEKSERMARIAMMDIALRDEKNITIRCTDSLLDFRNYPDLKPGIADVVITNPPFGSLLGAETVKTLGAFDLAAGASSVPLEVLGLERSVQLLRPGGRLGIVLPEGILSNAKTSPVRQWLDTKVVVRAIVALPPETFAPFGANVRTCVLFARRKMPGEAVMQDYGVALAKSECVGYDAAGRSANSDLLSVQKLLQEFLSSEGW